MRATYAAGALPGTLQTKSALSHRNSEILQGRTSWPALLLVAQQEGAKRSQVGRLREPNQI